MWINRDVDLPQALVAAQREGRLVIFAGAGVSMGPPANLPSLKDLAVQIAGGALDRRRQPSPWMPILAASNSTASMSRRGPVSS